MRLNEQHPTRVILNVEHVPIYLGFMLPGGKINNSEYGSGPYVILQNHDSRHDYNPLGH